MYHDQTTQIRASRRGSGTSRSLGDATTQFRRPQSADLAGNARPLAQHTRFGANCVRHQASCKRSELLSLKSVDGPQSAQSDESGGSDGQGTATGQQGSVLTPSLRD
eukprot:COSAG04_NODE_20656_length_389_cov_0.710345_1_plen_106_part_10